MKAPMSFEADGKMFVIEFKRKKKPVHVIDPFVRQVRRQIESTYPYTTCTVFEVDEGPRCFWKVYRTYTVGCFKRDQFNLEAGRKAALRAISLGTSLTKKFKAAMWKAYLERPTGPPEPRSKASVVEAAVEALTQ